MHHSPKLLTLAAIFLAATAEAANRRQPLDQLTDESDLIVLGRVGVKTSYWGDESRIYSDFVISPELALKGAAEGAVVIRLLGGVVGDTEMTVSDGPEFQEGEQALVFLKRGQDRFEVVGREAGKYRAGTPEAADAVEHVLRRLEKLGEKLDHKRSLAESYLDKARTPVRDQLTGTTTTTSTTAACYSAPGAKWGTTSVTYKPGAGVPSTWAPSINAAASAWSAAGSALRLTNNLNSTNELSLLDLVAKYGSTYSNTYALATVWSSTTTNQITRATIEINNRWQWSTSGQANMADVQGILTHEFGHWLRLMDIYSPAECGEVTMWGTAMLGEVKKRTLEQPDINGIIALYGRSASIGTPVLTSPANNAIGILTTPTLTWSTASGATSYDVYLGTSSSPALVASVAATSYRPTVALSGGSRYYWRVVARNSTGTASSATWSFTTAGTLPAPVLVSPANGSTGVSLTPVLKWNAVTGATSYDLYFGGTSSPAYLGTVSATSVTISGLAIGTTYYWRIVAKGAAGASSSATWSLRTY